MIDFSTPRHANKLGYLLLAPAVVLVVAIIVYPILISFDLSLQNVKIARIGEGRLPWSLQNYQKLLTSPDFWQSTWVTAKLIVVVVGFTVVIGMATALLVNEKFKGRALARLFIALPWAVPEVVAVMIWWWIFDSSFGLMNWLLVNLDIATKPVAWLSNPDAAFAAVSTVMIWKGYPFVSIMLLAGLQSVPEEMYHAAKVDGAGPFQRFAFITLPTLSPVIFVTLIFVVLWVFRDFTIIFVLTGGGPIGATETLSIMTYEEAFSFFRMGNAAAVGVITLVFCVIISRFLIGRSSAMY